MSTNNIETRDVSDPNSHCDGPHSGGVRDTGSLVVIVRILPTLSRVQSGLTKGIN